MFFDRRGGQVEKPVDWKRIVAGGEAWHREGVHYVKERHEQRLET